MINWQPVCGGLILLTILAGPASPSHAQINPVWTETVTSPGDESDNAADLAIDSDGNIYITGRGTYSHGGSTNLDYMTVKFNPDGVIEWTETINSDVTQEVNSSDDYAFGIAIDQSDRIAVTGTRYYEASDNSDMYTVLYDQNGDTIWTQRFASASGSFDAGFDVVADDFYGVYVTGQSSIDGSTVDFFTIRYDTDGDSLWSQFNDGTNSSGQDYPTGLVIDASGQCYVTGNESNLGSALDIATICYDTDGTILWKHAFDSGEDNDDEAAGIAISSTGDVYVAGRANVVSGATTTSRSPGQLTSIEGVIIKYDGLGDTAWVRYYDGPAGNSDDFADIAISSDDSLIAATGGSFDAGFSYEIVTAVYQPNGDTAWVRRWESPSEYDAYGWSVAFGRNNEVWVTGYTASGLGFLFFDVVVLRYSASGELLNVYTYDGSADRDEGLDIAFDDNVTGHMIVAGNSVSAATGSDFLGIGVFGPGPIIEVTNTNDAGDGSLRRAIENANATPGADVIQFTASGELTLGSPLPAIVDPDLTIQGYTAPGVSPGMPSFIVNGGQLLSGHGITVATSNTSIQGLGIHGFPGDGIRVTGAGTQNTFSANLIYDNGGLAIDLGGDGVTLNDVGDGDAGANNLLNYPVIEDIYLTDPDSFNVSGTATPSALVELYVAEQYVGGDTVADPSGHGESWIYLASTPATVGGIFAFPKVHIDHWARITAIQSDVDGNTSEFSPNRLVIPDSFVVTAYSPVTITVITPDSMDSIGPNFNTIGPDASYDSLTDWGLGPDSLPGEPDDQIVITNIQPGDYTINVSTKPGEDGNYFMGIRVDGTEESYVGPGVTSSPTPISNPAPPEGDPDVYTYSATPPQRGDLNGDGVLDAIDLNIIINMVFFNQPLPDPPQLVDLNCDTFPDALDLNYMIEHIFFNGPLPCH